MEQWLEVTIRTASGGIDLLCAELTEAGFDSFVIDDSEQFRQIEAYLKNLRSREPLTEFRETDWLAMVDYITVHSKKDIWVTFKDGTEIKA